jgi:hypothetical protein
LRTFKTVRRYREVLGRIHKPVNSAQGHAAKLNARKSPKSKDAKVEGSTGDPATLAAQVDKLKRRFDLAHVVLVGDRGIITQTRINQDIKPAGLDWITALRARRSASWSIPGSSSSRCSISAILPASPLMTIPASA